jgi:EmrB/QacA subfamily drug resistance transporter
LEDGAANDHAESEQAEPANCIHLCCTSQENRVVGREEHARRSADAAREKSLTGGYLRTSMDRRESPGRAVLVIACVAQFMVVLDISIVNVALPAMRRALDLTPAGQQWIVNAYVLVFGGCLLCGGRAADIYGRRRAFLAGLGLFSVASLAGGLADSGGMLIAARAVQGLGGAVLAPATLSLITTTYVDPRERTRALTAWAATAASGGAFGVVSGGVLTDTLGWRAVLFVNIPIGIALFAASLRFVTELARDSRSRALDLPGTLAVTGGLALFIYAIVTTDKHSWGSLHTLGLLALSLGILAGFVAIELRARDPMVPLGIFRNRALSGANAIAMLLGGVITAQIFFMSLYLQQVNRYSPLRAGVVLLAPTACALVASIAAGKLVGRVGPRALLIAGPLLAAAGSVWLGQLDAGDSAIHLILPALPTVLGCASCFVPMTMSATAGVELRDAGLASGLINSSRQVGAAVGLAALVTVATSHTASLLQRGGTSAPEALTRGYDRGFMITAAMALAMALIAALVLPRIPTRGRVREEARDVAVALEGS